MKFLDSQHNLRHSNLSEIPIEDSNKIFKGRPSLGSSDAGISILLKSCISTVIRA